MLDQSVKRRPHGTHNTCAHTLPSPGSVSRGENGLETIVGFFSRIDFSDEHNSIQSQVIVCLQKGEKSLQDELFWFLLWDVYASVTVGSKSRWRQKRQKLIARI